MRHVISLQCVKYEKQFITKSLFDDPTRYFRVETPLMHVYISCHSEIFANENQEQQPNNKS